MSDKQAATSEPAGYHIVYDNGTSIDYKATSREAHAHARELVANGWTDVNVRTLTYAAPPAAHPAPSDAHEFWDAHKDEFLAMGDREIVAACFKHFAALSAKQAGVQEAPTTSPMCERKTNDIMQRDGYQKTGYVLMKNDPAARICVSDQGAVSWFTREQWDWLMHNRDHVEFQWPKPIGATLSASSVVASVPSTVSAVPADPMDWPLPCDVKVGAGTNKKGTSLRALITRMQILHDAANASLPPSAGAPVEAAEASSVNGAGFKLAGYARKAALKRVQEDGYDGFIWKDKHIDDMVALYVKGERQ